MNIEEVQNAIDTLTDGDELRKMTRHNAADFVHATVVVVEAAKLMADPNKVAMQQVVHRYQPDFDDPDYVDELWDAALSEDRM